MGEMLMGVYVIMETYETNYTNSSRSSVYAIYESFQDAIEELERLKKNSSGYIAYSIVSSYVYLKKENNNG